MIQGNYEKDPYLTFRPSYITKPLGAFWVDESFEVPSLNEMKEDLALSIIDYQTFEIKHTHDAEYSKLYMEKLIHIGSIVSRYSDYQVENFSQRIFNSQAKRAELQKLKDESISSSDSFQEKSLVANNLDLELGLEVKERLFRTLRSIRPFGTSQKLSVPLGLNSLQIPLEESVNYFPEQWNNASLDKLKFSRGKLIKEMRRHSAYSHETGKIFISNKIDREIYSVGNNKALENMDERTRQNLLKSRALTHEMSHFFTAENIHLNSHQKTMLINRALESGHQRSYVDEKDVNLYPDHFVDPYIGRDYQKDLARPLVPFAQTEIFSMGMEAISHGELGSLIGLHDTPPDPDHRNFVIGILATLKMPD